VIASGVSDVSAGNAYVLILKTDGTVWACGENTNYQLGDGTTKARFKPVQVAGLPAAVAIAAGSATSYAVTTDGSVWAWGANTWGQIGDGSLTNRKAPVKVPFFGRVRQVAATQSGAALAVTQDGSVWTWGSNANGELGTGAFASYSASPVKVASLSGVWRAQGGDGHFLTVDNLGYVKSWGANDAGELGDGLNQATGQSLRKVPDYVVDYLSKALTNNNTVGAGQSSTFVAGGVVLQTSMKAFAYQAIYGAPITSTARITDQLKGAIANQPVSLLLDGAPLPTVYTDANGSIAVKLQDMIRLTRGNHRFDVNYAGSIQDAPSSVTLTLTVTIASSKIYPVDLSGRPGDARNLNAVLRVTSNNAIYPGAKVSVSIDGVAFGSGITDGTGTVSLPYTFGEGLAVGAHTVNWSFAGDNNLNPITATSNLTVSQCPTALALPAVSGAAGTTVSLVSTLTRTSDSAGVKGRTVTFTVDGASVGTATSDANGVATLSYSIPKTAAKGAHTLGSKFAGESLYGASTAASTLTVK